MSAAGELLQELRTRGASVRVDGDKLRIAPASAVDPELLERLRSAKPAMLALLRAAPPDLALSARGRDALGGGPKPAAPAPATRPLVAAPPEERGKWLRGFFEDASIPLAVIETGPLGRFILVRDTGALEALDPAERADLPLLGERELLALAPQGIEAVRALLDTRRIFGPQVELRAVRSRPLDG